MSRGLNARPGVTVLHNKETRSFPAGIFPEAKRRGYWAGSKGGTNQIMKDTGERREGEAQTEKMRKKVRLVGVIMRCRKNLITTIEPPGNHPWMTRTGTTGGRSNIRGDGPGPVPDLHHLVTTGNTTVNANKNNTTIATAGISTEGRGKRRSLQ